MTEQIKRITENEERMDHSRKVIDALKTALEDYQNNLETLEAFSGYYGSKEWMEDFEADEMGQLPQDLRRGVLSEDLGYELLMDNHELISELLKLAGKILESEDNRK